MAQDPYKVDQVQIEPGSEGTRLIRRRAADGSLEFSDGVAGALSLKQLAGLNLTGLLTVGAGAGAQYTTIQSAIDAIPIGGSPYTVLIGPGSYAETVTLQKTNVTLLGLGWPTITQSSGHTLVVQAGGGTTPFQVTVQGIVLNNADPVSACARIIGGAGSDVGRDGINIIDCDLIHDAGGGRTLWATSVCIVDVCRCRLEGNDALALVSNCGQVWVTGSEGKGAYEWDYDSAGTLPSLITGDYSMRGCHVGTSLLVPEVAVTLNGGGTFNLRGTYLAGDVRFSGDQTVVLYSSVCQDVTLEDTVAVSAANCNHGTVTAAIGTSLSESSVQGTASFVNVDHVDVAFDAPQPDANYVVILEPGSDSVYVSAKMATGFTITAGGLITTDINWIASRAQI